MACCCCSNFPLCIAIRRKIVYTFQTDEEAQLHATALALFSKCSHGDRSMCTEYFCCQPFKMEKGDYLLLHRILNDHGENGKFRGHNTALKGNEKFINVFADRLKPLAGDEGKDMTSDLFAKALLEACHQYITTVTAAVSDIVVKEQEETAKIAGIAAK